MNRQSIIKIDNRGKGLPVSVISNAISKDKDITRDDIEKLREIKKQLQEN